LIDINAIRLSAEEIRSISGDTLMNDDDKAAGLISQVLSSWRDWRETRRQRGELAALTPDEMVGIAADCGVSPADLVDAVKSGRHGADELAQLAEALGLDFEHLKEAGYFNDMQRLCSECAEKKRCRRALAKGVASLTYETFCPNADTLAYLEHVQNMLQPFPHR
jgi:uncharacterized protein YjiS (DUF1127 family)